MLIHFIQAFHTQYDIAETLLPKISQALEEKMSSLDGEHLAIVGKIFGRFDPAAPLFMFWKFTLSNKLFEAASAKVLDICELVTVVWALCKAENKPETLLAQIGPKVRASMLPTVQAKLKPRNLAELAWLLSQNLASDTELAAKVASSSEERLAEFNLQELTDLASGFTELGAHTDPLMTKIATLIEQHHLTYLNLLSPSSLSQLAWALSKSSLLSRVTLLTPIIEIARQQVTSYSNPGRTLIWCCRLNTMIPTAQHNFS